MPASVRLFWKVKVLPAVPVRVYVPAVKMLPLIEVAVATPSDGVVSAHDTVRQTVEPVPLTALTPLPFILNTLPVPAVCPVTLDDLLVEE